MILAALIGLSLVTHVAFDSGPPAGTGQPSAGMSTAQNSAILRRMIRSATECVVHTVSTDPRFPQVVETGDVNTLIVDSMDRCGDAMQAMIEAHDRMFGPGSGETFFMGPYLDTLPDAVSKRIQEVAH
jgi:hypothetical protein